MFLLLLSLFFVPFLSFLLLLDMLAFLVVCCFSCCSCCFCCRFLLLLLSLLLLPLKNTTHTCNLTKCLCCFSCCLFCCVAAVWYYLRCCLYNLLLLVRLVVCVLPVVVAFFLLLLHCFAFSVVCPAFACRFGGRLWPTLARPSVATFGRDPLWPSRPWPRPSGLWGGLWPHQLGRFWWGQVDPVQGTPQPRTAPPDRPHRTGPPSEIPPKISRFFFLLPLPFHSFFLSLEIFSCLFFSLRVSSCVFLPLSAGLLVESVTTSNVLVFALKLSCETLSCYVCFLLSAACAAAFWFADR